MPSGPSPSPPSEKPAPGTRRRGSLLRAALPWVVAVVALLWVVRTVLGLPPRDAEVQRLVGAFRQVPLALFLGSSVVLLFLNCAADSFAMLYTFRWFKCRLPYREIFVVRASTYLLAVVQYYVGQAAIIAFLHKRRGVAWVRATGWILFISAINLGVLVLLAAVGLAGGDIDVKWLAAVPFAVAGGSLLYALLLYKKPQGLARVRVFEPLFEMGVTGHLKAILVRLPHVLVLIVWHFLALRWFGVRVPPFTALVLLPAVFFAAALPISVQGLGLSQMAAVYFFARYAPAGREAVLAYSIAMTAVSFAVQIAMGILFLPAGKRIGLETHPDPAAEEAAEAEIAAARAAATTTIPPPATQALEASDG